MTSDKKYDINPKVTFKIAVDDPTMIDFVSLTLNPKLYKRKSSEPEQVFKGNPFKK